MDAATVRRDEFVERVERELIEEDGRTFQDAWTAVVTGFALADVDAHHPGTTLIRHGSDLPVLVYWEVRGARVIGTGPTILGVIDMLDHPAQPVGQRGRRKKETNRG